MFAPDVSIFPSVLSCAVLLFCSFGIGSLFREKSAFITFASGFAVLSFIGWIFPTLTTLAIPLAVLLSLCAICGSYKLFSSLSKEYRYYLVGAGIFLAASGSYLIPPYSWDECVYQTALLKHYVENQSNAVLADNPFSAFPSLPHSAMRLGIELFYGNLYLPRILSGAILVITLTTLLKIIVKNGAKHGVFIFAAALLSPVTLILARANYVEQYTLFFGTAGALSIWKLRHHAIKCAFFAALFASAALCVKLTGAGIALALAVFYLFTVPKKRFAIQCAAALATFAVFSLPFFLRPYLATGNPFYPFAAGLFTSDNGILEVSRYHHLLGSYRYGLDALSGVALGWLFAAFNASIFDGIVTNWQFPALLGSCILGTFKLFHTSSRRFKIAGILLVSAAVLYIFWAFSSQQTRFLLPLLWLLAVTSGFILKAFPRKQAVIFAVAVLACGFISFPVNHLKHFVTAWKIQKNIRQDVKRFLVYASRDSGYFEMTDFLKTTPKDSKVLLLLNERRTLYMPRKCRIGEPFFQELNTPVPENAGKLWENIKGFDYIVTSSSAHNPDIQKSMLPEFLKVAEMLNTLKEQQRLQLVFSDRKGEYLIFRCCDTATGDTL